MKVVHFCGDDLPCIHVTSLQDALVLPILPSWDLEFLLSFKACAYSLFAGMSERDERNQ